MISRYLREAMTVVAALYASAMVVAAATSTAAPLASVIA